MWKSLLKRMGEPSTYAGLAGVAMATDQMNIFNEGAQVAQTLGEVGGAVAAGNPIAAVMAFAFGMFAIFKGEKGEK